MAADDLAARLDRLEAVQAIHALKAHYARCADEKFTDAMVRRPQDELDLWARRQAECFTEDAVWEGGSSFGASIRGREGLFGFFRKVPWQFAIHYYVAPELALEGDEGEGSWRLWQAAVRDDGEVVLLAGRTRERYRRVAGQWLKSAMRFESLHMIPCGIERSEIRRLIPEA